MDDFVVCGEDCFVEYFVWLWFVFLLQYVCGVCDVVWCEILVCFGYCEQFVYEDFCFCDCGGVIVECDFVFVYQYLDVWVFFFEYLQQMILWIEQLYYCDVVGVDFFD